MEGETLIQARQLSRRYGPKLAVADLNLTLQKGEVLGLLGPNGAGKTTTLKMLAGCLAPTSGDIQIKGKSLQQEPLAAKHNLGYLPERPPLYPELTVDEYLRYCAGLHGVPTAERESAVSRSKAACGLTDVARRSIGNLSKGYQQRVGLAQAIIHRPPVIILDEPTVGLDPIQIREIRALITELGKSHSVILSSHILPEIHAVCSRVLIINAGRVVYDQPIQAAEGKTFESLIVALRKPPETGQLMTLKNVTGVETLDAGRYRLHIAPGSDPRDAIAETAVRNGWGLTELRAEVKTLEEIFVQLTSVREAA